MRLFLLVRLSVHVMDRPWEPFDRARRVLRGRDDLAGWKSADLPSVSMETADFFGDFGK